MRARRGRRSRMAGVHGETDRCGCGMASAAVPVAYNEEAFRYFLNVERRRAEISNRPFVLLLLNLRRAPVPDGTPPPSETLLAALSHFVRETDFIGWFRERSVVGAVLTQHSETAGRDLSEQVSRRVVQGLGDRLPSELARRVRVRVYQLPGATRNG
jgi:hypothetical protein